MRFLLFILIVTVVLPCYATETALTTKSRSELKEAIKDDPTALGAWYLLAKSYLGLRDEPPEDTDFISKDLHNSAAYYEDALVRIENEEIPAAIIQLRNAVKTDENNLSAWILLASLYSETRAPRTAEYCLRQAQKNGADPNLVLVPLAESLLASEQFEVLIRDIPLATVPPNLRPRIKVMHGRAYLGLRQFAKAKEMFEDAMREDPDLVWAHIESARLSLVTGDIAQARDELVNITGPGQYNPDYWLLRGEIERVQDDLDAAIADFDKALSLDEDHRLALTADADLNMRKGNIVRASELISTLREFYPNDLRGLQLELGLASQQGDDRRLDQVVETAQSVVDKLDYAKLQDDPYGLFVVGTIHFLSGHMTEAATLLAQYVDLVPRDLHAIRLLVTAQLDTDQFDPASRTLRDATRELGDVKALWPLKAQTYIARKEYTRALVYLDKLVDESPTDRSMRLLRAKANASLGKHAIAIAELTQLRDQDEDAEIDTTLSNLLLAERKYDTVLRMFEGTTGFAATADADIIRGKALFGQGKVADARKSFETALSKSPGNVEAIFNIALIERRNGQLSSAEKGFKSVLNIDGKHRLAMLQLATMAEETSQEVEAIKYLKQAFELQPDVKEGLRLISLLLDTHREQEARETMNRLRLQHPENLEVMAADARVNLLGNNVERARQIYTNMRNQALNDKSVPELVKTARYQFDIDDKQNAMRTLADAANLEPQSLQVLVTQADFKQREGHYEQALDLAGQVIKQAPREPVGYQLKGDSYRDLGRPADALAAYQSGVDNTPGSLALVLNYYTLLQAEQGPGKALTFLEDIVRRQAETVSFTLLRVLAAGYTEAGEPVKSIALHETLLKSRPNDPILLNNLALAYFENGDDRARDVAQKAYDLAPDNYAVMDTLGWILVNAGDASVGVTLLRNALARSANVPDIRYHYAVALNRNGQTKTAARELQSLLSDGQPFTEREAARALYEQLRGSGSN